MAFLSSLIRLNGEPRRRPLANGHISERVMIRDERDQWHAGTVMGTGTRGLRIQLDAGDQLEELMGKVYKLDPGVLESSGAE